MVICIALFLFYIFAYFPILKNFSTSEKAQSMSLLLPTITGHSIPLLSGFFTRVDPLINPFCPRNQLNCALWQKDTTNCQNYWVMNETLGCCARLESIPEESCVQRVQTTAFFVLCAMLIFFYFGLGIFVGWLIYKKNNKHKKTNL